MVKPWPLVPLDADFSAFRTLAFAPPLNDHFHQPLPAGHAGLEKFLPARAFLCLFGGIFIYIPDLVKTLTRIAISALISLNFEQFRTITSPRKRSFSEIFGNPAHFLFPPPPHQL
jgi:hypothetical protein